MIIAPNATNVSVYFKLVDPTTRIPETGLVITNLDAVYVRDRAAAVKNDLTALALVTSPHSDNKAIEIDATNAPGLYRVDFPDAAFSSGVDRVQLIINGAAIDPAIIEVELSAPGIISNAVWDEILTGATHNVPTSAGRRLRSIADIVIYEGSTVSSTNNTITLNGTASTVDGAYDPAMIYMVSGVSTGQTRLILQYDGATKLAIVDRDWKTNPQAGDEFVIAGNPGREHVNEGRAQAGGADWIQLNVLASNNDDVYNGQVVFIRSGTGQDQARRIINYDGATHIAYIDPPWDTQPDNTSAGAILPTALLTNEYIANAVWDAAMASHVIPGTTGKAVDIASNCGLGAGATAMTYTLTNSGTGLPIADADVWATTDILGANIVASGKTNALGQVTFWLDSGVTYYIWRQKDGFTFVNPDTEVVP